MQKFLALTKKEIKELITPQMIVPLIAMVVLFGALGGIISGETEKMKEDKPLYVATEEQGVQTDEALQVLRDANFELTTFADRQAAISQAKADGVSSIIVIPQGFSDSIANMEPVSLPSYSLVNNFSLTATMKSQAAGAAAGALQSHYMRAWLEQSDTSLTQADLQSAVTPEEHVIIKDREAQVSAAAVFGFLQKQTTFIPIILFLIIILASQMVATAVATEKENKTFETLLSLPLNRKTIVFAKLVGAGIVAFLFAGVYMIGFGKYMQGVTGGALTAGADAATQLGPALNALGIEFGWQSYVMLGLSLFAAIMLGLAIAITLGILADSVKSVQAVVTPLMIMILIPYILVMFVDISQVSQAVMYAVYAIPFSHPFLAIQKLVTHDYAFIFWGIIYQLIWLMGFVALAARIFSSDKVLTLNLKSKFGKKNK